MNHITYLLREDTVFDEKENAHLVYGVDAVTPRGEKKASFPDLFFDRKKAEAFVALCNEGQLPPAHLADVVEDILGKG